MYQVTVFSIEKYTFGIDLLNKIHLEQRISGLALTPNVDYRSICTHRRLSEFCGDTLNAPPSSFMENWNKTVDLLLVRYLLLLYLVMGIVTMNVTWYKSVSVP